MQRAFTDLRQQSLIYRKSSFFQKIDADQCFAPRLAAHLGQRTGCRGLVLRR
jgi:hypothetical protein